LGKIRRRLAQDLVGLTQLADVAFQRLHLVSDLGRDASALAAVHLRLLYQLMHRLRNAADLLDNGIYRRPSPWVIALVIQHHPYRSLADLRRALVRRLAHIGSTFSEVVASDEPRAVRTPRDAALS
jgi:hypothetical protein